MGISIFVTKTLSTSAGEGGIEVKLNEKREITVPTGSVCLTSNQLSHPLINEMWVYPGGYMKIYPKKLSELLKPDSWLYRMIPKRPSSYSHLARFSQLRRSEEVMWAVFQVRQLRTKNIGALIIGPDDYSVRINWD